MKKSVMGELLRRCLPVALKARTPVWLKARMRSLLGIEPWPDLAVRHAIFRSADYRRLRARAGPFDAFRKPYKPVIERGHQASYLVAGWFAASGVKRAFHVGYSNGRYLFYLSAMGVDGGGTEFPLADAPETPLPAGVLPPEIERRLLRLDFFELDLRRVRAGWEGAAEPLDVIFTEATFETLFPWRRHGFSVEKYRTMETEGRRRLLEERLPGKLAELKDGFRNMIFIEPEPGAGGAGAVFERCARRLPELAYSVWMFRPPFDRLFRLSPSQPTKQAVYGYTRDPRLLDGLARYAQRV